MKKNILRTLWMLATILMLTACSEKDDNADNSTDPTPVNPEKPISSDDWQTVSTSGGTIEKGDIAISFPAGTFSSDTKVAITEVKEGESCGDYEVSKFYQLTMPGTVHKAITVQIKSDRLEDDPIFATSSLGYRKSAGELFMKNLNFEPVYADGRYSMTIPASENGDNASNQSFIIGLANPDQGTAGANSHTHDASGKSYVLSKTHKWPTGVQGKVGNIEWYFDCSWRLSFSQKLDCQNNIPTYNKYVEEAIKQIQDLGFTIKTSCKIPIVFDILYTGSVFNLSKEKDMETFGNFVQSPYNDGWNSIELNVNTIFSAGETTMKQTIIHEILHYFQSHYDPRWPCEKSGGEDDILSEAGSVWAEQFMNNGKLNSSFIKQFLPLYLVSLKDLDVAYSNDGAKDNKGLQYRRSGYAMSTLLYYLTTPECHKKMGWDYKYLGIDKYKIVEIYQKWKDYQGQSYRPFERWIANYCGFMDSDQFDSYILCLLTGNLLEGVNVATVGYPDGFHSRKAIFKSNGKEEFDGNCYCYGCASSRFELFQYTNEKGEKSYKGKNIIIKHDGEDLTSYVIAESKNKEYKLIKGKANSKEDLAISGDDLEKLFGEDRVAYLHVVTINHINKIQAYPFKVSCEIKDAEKAKFSKVEIERVIGKFKMKPIITGSYEYQGVDKRDKDYFNCSLTDSGNTLHVNGTHKETRGTCTDETTISFDIIGTSGDCSTWKIQNLKYNYLYVDTQEKNSDKSYFVVRHELRFELTDLPNSTWQSLKDSAGKPYIWIRFYGSKNEEGGLKVTDAYYKEETYSYGQSKTEECSGVVDYVNNEFTIALNIWE